MIGTQTTCFVAQAAGLPQERCTIVSTGDEIQLGDTYIDFRTLRGQRGDESFDLTGREVEILKGDVCFAP